MIENSSKSLVVHARMKEDRAASKRGIHSCIATALAFAVLLCPFIAQTAENLRAPEDPELSNLAARISNRVQLSREEKDWLATRPRVHVRVGDYPPFHFVTDDIPRGLGIDYMRTICAAYGLDCDYFYSSVAAASIALPLLIAALLTIRRMRRQIEARRAAEDRLQVSESRLRAAMEGTETGLWEWNPQTGEVYLDPVWFTMLGYAPDAMPHAFETFESLVHPDDLPKALESISAIVGERHNRFEIEFRMRHSDGHSRWILSKGSLLATDSAGMPSRLIGVHTDITEQRKAAEQYRAFLTENIGTVAWIAFKHPVPIDLSVEDQVDRILEEGFIKDISEACAKDYGQSREMLLGQPITVLWAPDSYQGRDSELHQYLQHFVRSGYIDTGVDPSHEITRFGEEKWFLTSMKGVVENGHLDHIWGSQVDMTESKLRETERDELFKRLQKIAANIPGFIYQYRQRPDGDSRLEYVSGNLESVYGVSADVAVESAKPIFDAVHPDDIESLLASIARSAAALTEWHEEYRVIHPSGRMSWAEGRSTPERLQDGSIVWYGYQSNITERKQQEQRLQEYRQRLKSLAGQLTLAEERERRRIAADLHDDVGQSLALTRLQLAAARKSLPAEDPLAAQLEDISQSLLRAIQETRHLIFELSSPALNELGLGAAIADWSEEQAGRRHGLRVEVFDHARQLVLDADQRAIMFRNVRELITNVIKHAEASTLSIWLEQEDSELVVVVQDHGIGFNPDKQLYEVDSGKGFGLFSIQERMTDLGGNLKLVSQPGAGCKAILRLPLQTRKPETHA